MKNINNTMHHNHISMRHMNAHSIITIFVLCAIAFPAVAAAKGKPDEGVSEYDKFVYQPGVLIVEEYYSGGSVYDKYDGKLGFAAKVAYDKNKKKIVKALSVSGTEQKNEDNDFWTWTYAIIDHDELPSLISALRYMLSMKFSVGKDHDHISSSYQICTRTGVLFDYSQSDDDATLYIHLGEGYSRVYMQFKAQDLSAILNEIIKVKQKLDSM